jgi:O-antigen ligase
MVCLALTIMMALVLSMSRGGWMAATVGLIFMGALLLMNQHFSRKKLLLSGVVGVLGLSFIVVGSTPVVARLTTMMHSQQDASFQSRLIAWKGVIRTITDYPVFGTGPGTFSLIFTQYQPPGFARRFMNAHNDYLHYASEVGLLLIPVLLVSFFALYRKGFKKLDNPSRLVRGMTLGALSAVTAMLLHSLFDFNLHVPANAFLFTVLTAVVVAPLPRDNLPNRKQKSVPPSADPIPKAP